MPGMRWGVSLLLLVLAGGTGRAETIDLREAGRLDIFVAGEWKITSDDMGDRFAVMIVPKLHSLAAARLTVNLLATDEPNTKFKLRQRVFEVCQQFVEKSVERKVTLQEIYRREGFGFYSSFTDPELAGKPPKPDKFKVASYGVVRLAPKVYVSMQIFSDDVTGAPFQALLGAVEGMELRPPRR